jgi:transcription elongation factor GreA
VNAEPPVDQSTSAHRVAEVGALTEFEDLESHALSSFELVVSADSNIGRGRLSVDAPVGRALLGHRPGDVVEVITPKGRRRLKLVDIH